MEGHIVRAQAYIAEVDDFIFKIRRRYPRVAITGRAAGPAPNITTLTFERM